MFVCYLISDCVSIYQMSVGNIISSAGRLLNDHIAKHVLQYSIQSIISIQAITKIHTKS